MKYNQGKDGACVAFAIANAVEAGGGRVLKHEEVLDIFKVAGKGNRLGGAQLEDCLIEFEKRGLIKGYELLHQAFRRPNVSAVLDTALKGKPMVFGLRMREGKPSIPLDDNFVYTPRSGKIKGFHALFCIGIKSLTSKSGPRKTLLCYSFENSWGEEWGDNGNFNMMRKDFQTEINVVYKIIL